MSGDILVLAGCEEAGEKGVTSFLCRGQGCGELPYSVQDRPHDK